MNTIPEKHRLIRSGHASQTDKTVETGFYSDGKFLKKNFKYYRDCFAGRVYSLICVLALVSLIVTIVIPLPAIAGGGPETVLVVVNGESPLSMYIANAYVKMREIPQNHVVWLHNIPSLKRINIDAFRNRIWKPIREHIKSNGLDREIDTIVYSADFPYSVQFSDDLKKSRLLANRKLLGSTASMTGLTYFARRVESGDIGYLGINRYFRRDLSPQVRPPRPPSKTEIEQYKNARKALRKKDYKGAAEILQSLAGSYPWNNHIWYDLARCLAALGKTKDAMQALTKAVDTGWAHSLSVRTDKHLKRLNGHSGFASLINRMKTMKGQFQPARGFRSHYIWTGGDEPLIIEAVESLDRYYLSTFLAYTGIRGNSAQEVLSYLGAAASSDGSSPDGTVYLLENRNIRALTRERYFHATVEALAERGRDAEILTKWQDGENGIIPQNKDDIIGAVVGAERFDWGSSKSRLLPGAIAESLTSYGGHFNKAKQTKLTEFLRHGAAGSSGAVVEPYAKQAKFPVSYLHVHYADGSSLAEAFYQSVEAPYQLIIVGDPLARPFAHFAKVRLLTPDPGQSWRGTVLIKPYVQAANGRTVGRVELWVDGQYVDDKPAGEVIPWDTIEVEDGSHDLRLVAVEATPMETRSYIRIPVKVANTGNRMAVDDVRKPVIFGDDIVLTGSASDARSVQLFQGVRLIGSADVESGRWKLHVPSRLLGPGDVILFMRVLFRDGTIYRSKPIDIHIEKPLLIKAGKHNGQSSKHGLEGVVKYKSGRNREIVIKKLNGRLKELGKDKKGVSFIRVEGEFNVKETGFYQLVVSTTGKIHIEVDYSVILDDELDKDDGDRFLPLSLESGWHSLKLELIPKGPPRIRVVMNGEQVAELLEGDMLRH